MTLGNPNTEAYEIMADVVVTVRRIVQRGLVKASGETWYLDGLPPGLFEKLVARKESEIAIDRFDDEYQELISYASFDDLAETIEFNRDLSELLAWLAPEGMSIVDRLREVEGLRLKLAAFVPFSDDDLEAVIEFHQELGQMLRKRTAAPPETEDAESSEPADIPEEGVEDIFEEEAEAETLEEVVEDADEDEKDSGDSEDEAESDADALEEVVDGSQEAEDEPEEIEEETGGEGEAEVELEGGEDLTTQFAEIDELTKSDVIVPEDFGTVAARLEVSASSKAKDGVDSEDAVAVERAMASDDSREVLRVLRREVMSVAESVLQNDPEQQHPVWEAIRSSGWFEIKREELGIDAVEKFYGVAEGVLDKRLAGHSSDEVKEYLEESEFSRLLLSLREMFLQHNL